MYVIKIELYLKRYMFIVFRYEWIILFRFFGCWCFGYGFVSYFWNIFSKLSYNIVLSIILIIVNVIIYVYCIC